MRLKICLGVALAIGMAHAENGQAQKKAEPKKKSTPPALPKSCRNTTTR